MAGAVVAFGPNDFAAVELWEKHAEVNRTWIVQRREMLRAAVGWARKGDGSALLKTSEYSLLGGMVDFKKY